MLEVKNFGKYESLSLDQKRNLYHFREINDFIEQNSGLTKAIIQSSYEKVLLSDNFDGFEELDYQVKKVIDNTELSLNSILGFLEKKFSNKILKVDNFLQNKGFFTTDEHIHRFLDGKVKKMRLFYFGSFVTFSNEGIVGENDINKIIASLEKQYREQVGDDIEIEYFN